MSDEFQIIIVDDTENLVVEIENQVQPDIEVSINQDPTALIVEVDNGIVGPQGPTGSPGQGVPVGGTYGQMLTKNSSTNYDTSWVDGVLVTTVRNNTGATLIAGSVVYINGMLGNRPTVAKSQANSEATSARTYGLVAQDIADNADGPVVHAGECRNLNTFGVTEGVVLYLSPTVAGGYTTTKPVAPDHMVYVGVCTRAHPTQGTIEVNIQNGFELQELHNVLISSPTNKQSLVYESSTQLWKNQTLTPSDIGAQPALGFTPEDVANKSTNTSLGTSNTLYPSQGAVKTYVDTGLSGKQNTLGFTPEDVANKSTNTSLGTSNTLYPTQNAVKTYVDSAVAGGVPDATSTVKGKLKLAGDLGGTADLPTVPGLANKANTSTTISTTAPLSGGGDLSANRTLSIFQASGSTDGYLSSTDWNTFNGKQAALGFTPENVTNKATGLASPDNTKYPTTLAVSTALSGKQDSLGFTPENVANKATSLTSPDNTKYPTTLAVSTGLGTKQDTLVSGTNIKTINGSSILGSGNLVVTGGSGLGDSFETVSKNLKAYDYIITYSGGVLDEMTYDLGGGLSVVKSFNYNIDGTLATIVLSGDIPSGITTTKTFIYSGGNLTGIDYT